MAAEGPTTVEDANYDVDKIQEQLDKGDAVDVHSDSLTAQDFRFTVRDGHLYAIAFGWPEDGTFHIRSLREGVSYLEGIRHVSMVGCGEPVSYARDGEGLHVKAPLRKPCESAYVLKIER